MLKLAVPTLGETQGLYGCERCCLDMTVIMLKVNPLPNKHWFLRVCSRSLLKTLQEKEKLLVTSNFSFSHNVFYPVGQLSAILIKLKIVVCNFFQFEGVQNLLFGKGLSKTSLNHSINTT